ncbi:putative glycoside hydrolase [Niveibacterium terrae]|uniref:putative glycoside hydrolase n=1 Tax=Niveibacterium terrae TaxID=3373598 RepID=UPI003A8ED9A0
MIEKTLLLFFALTLPLAAAALDGRVLDAQSGQPIADAQLTVGALVVRSDARGVFRIAGAPGKIAARAPGYRRIEQNVAPGKPVEIRLAPFRAKALYLSFYGIGDRGIRNQALDLIERTELNALVIDFKGDRGMIPFKSSVPLASEIGALDITTVRDIRELIATLKQKGVYLIARIVVFKDDKLANARPALAVRTKKGGLWRDREDLAWVDPFREAVWDYNIKLAVEAAGLGFDEIQFDYLRFPDAESPVFSQPSTERGRVGAISSFLAAARKALAPYNVFIAGDIFGYVSWNLDDTQIGQRLDALVQHLDYLSPMLYPSGFRFGIPGYRDPVAHSREIVGLSLKRAGERSKVSPLRFRPWLQAFRDYAFDRRVFGAGEIREQISAAEAFGSDGWMLWNPRNDYSSAGLKSEPSAAR